jgi:transposase InsO family protein
MTVELASLGSKVSRITVAKYMNQLGLRSKLSKKFKVTTNSKHNHLIMPNVLKRIFGYRTFKSWVSIHIRVKEGFLYLTTVLDLYDRKIIGWSLSSGMSVEETSLAAWRMAIKTEASQRIAISF